MYLSVGAWMRMIEETMQMNNFWWIIWLPDLQKPAACSVPSLDSCLRRKYFILGMAMSSVLNINSPVFENIHTMPLACIQQ